MSKSILEKKKKELTGKKSLVDDREPWY